MVNEKTDWLKLKNEYINTNISQRKLADKHKVSFNTLKAKANKEKWANQRKSQHNKITKKIQQTTEEKIVASEVNRIENILSTTDEMQKKIDESLKQLNKCLSPDGKIIDGELVNIRGLKTLISALKDLSDIVAANDKTRDTEKLDAILDKMGGVI